MKTQRSERDLWIEMSVREISTQAMFAALAYGNINPKASRGTDLVFSSIHSFLSHCAMVSKLLNGQSDEKPKCKIADILNIPSSPIHKAKFRNRLEHYDKELKAWIKKYGTDVSIGTYNIGPKRAIQVPNLIHISHYDPHTDIFTLVNEDLNLGKLHQEAIHIKDIADHWIAEVDGHKRIPPFG